MTDSPAAPVDRPQPQPDQWSAPFFEAAKEGVLLLQHCQDCGAYQWPALARCTTCWSAALEWRPASGDGTLFSYSIVHQLYHPAFADDLPYNVCLVELPEGVRMYSSVVGVAESDLRVGMPLRVTFDAADGEIPLPRFVPAPDQQPD